jgi:ribosomal peptide maturation radical SAM protein 1
MPFGPVFNPSIGLSLLQAHLRHAAVRSSIRYFSIRYSEIVGERFYSGLTRAARPPTIDLAGEWIFSAELFDRADGDTVRYVEEVLRRRSAWTNRDGAPPVSDALIDRIVRAQHAVPAFLDWCLHEVIAASPKVIGFTSSFQQHVASLALARRVKQQLPDTFIVMGGANCEGVMGAETIRQFPFIDAVVSGEADLVIVDLARRALAGQRVDELPGVRTRATVAREFLFNRFSNAPVVREMDSLPFPEYSEYMDQFRASRHARDWDPNVLMESSRGCWWGEKAHCTFCGLNGSTMAFRSKSASRVLVELEHLAETCPGCDVEVVDNILDMRYFGDLLPELARRKLPFELFYETKANLKKEQVQLLRRAGVTLIQPGIESFSDVVLKLMKKGVSWLQNVQLLKWCKQFGVHPYWNVLWGFPGEPPEEYARMAQLTPWLTHLPAPRSMFGLRLDRFSPNFFDAERLGFRALRPADSYRHLYAELSPAARHNLAYYFQFDYADRRDVSSYVRPLLRQLRMWKRVNRRSDLFSIEAHGRLLVWDLRPAAVQPATILAGLDRRLYEACDQVTDVRALCGLAAGTDGMALPVDVVRQQLRPLVDRGLMVTDGTRYLSLAIPVGEYMPSSEVLSRFWQLVDRMGRRRRGGVLIQVGSRGGRRRRTSVSTPRRGSGSRSRVRRRLNPSAFGVTDDGHIFLRAGHSVAIQADAH